MGVSPALKGGILPPGSRTNSVTYRKGTSFNPPGETPGSTARETRAATPPPATALAFWQRLVQFPGFRRTEKYRDVESTDHFRSDRKAC